MHTQQECSSTNSEREINVFDHNIATVKVEFHDDSRMVEDIGSVVDENPLIATIETNIMPLVSNHTRVDRIWKATKKQKTSIKNDNKKYDCYLCNKRYEYFTICKVIQKEKLIKPIDCTIDI